jgi:UDP-N-acetyl-D-galactosamine dehydrogenase
MIKKVTSGSTEQTADRVDALYAKIINAGTYRAESIKIAEAAKVIENTQRDVNIALINELARFFNKLDIDTESVLKAAGTKWNFLPFVPGLVGGHCIGVDPYYLTHKAGEVGFDPKMILSGRAVNDDMGSYIAIEVSKLMTKKRINLVDANVLIMGLAFKENSPDIRNSGVARLVTTLQSFNCSVQVFDPWIDKKEAKKEFNIDLLDRPDKGKYDAIILAVAHDDFKELSLKEIKSYGTGNHVLYDVKYLFKQSEVDGRL